MQITVIHIVKHVNKLSKKKYIWWTVYLSTGSMLSVVANKYAFDSGTRTHCQRRRIFIYMIYVVSCMYSTTSSFYCFPSYVCNSTTIFFTFIFYVSNNSNFVDIATRCSNEHLAIWSWQKVDGCERSNVLFSQCPMVLPDIGMDKLARVSTEAIVIECPVKCTRVGLLLNRSSTSGDTSGGIE